MAEDVLYWPRTANIGLIPCNSRAKKVSIKGWQKLDLNNVDYEANQKAGLYKDGIAIRLGRCLTNGSSDSKASASPAFSFALDFDGWDAVVEWFGNWDK